MTTTQLTQERKRQLNQEMLNFMHDLQLKLLSLAVESSTVHQKRLIEIDNEIDKAIALINEDNIIDNLNTLMNEAKKQL